MSLRELKKELQKETKEKLISHLAELYKKYKPVKEYFDFYLNPDESQLLEDYKQMVQEGFFPSRGYDIKLSVARKALNDFKKMGVSPESHLQLQLYFVQCGVDCLNSYGDMWEAFYTSMENAFDKSLKEASELGLLSKFKPQIDKIMKGADDKGWGFTDSMGDIYHSYF